MSQEKSPPSRADRVYRPLGLAIAIAAPALWYGVIPLLDVYFLRRLDATANEAFLGGGVEISTWTWLQALLGGVILIICILAWWGYPPWIRFVLMGGIFLPWAITLYRIIEAWSTQIDPIFGGQAQAAERDFLLRCQLPGLIVVPLYVIWYLNRAPARAFYQRVPLSTLAPDSTVAETPDSLTEEQSG